MSLSAKHKIGLVGENFACRYLFSKKYQILARRYRAGHDELDIIAFDRLHSELVFLEVKTRSSESDIGPELALNQRKLKTMGRAANNYLQKTDYQGDYRFDLITIVNKSINHYENITLI